MKMVRVVAPNHLYMMRIEAVISHQRAAQRMSGTRRTLKIFASSRGKKSKKSMFHDLFAQFTAVARAAVTNQVRKATGQARTVTGLSLTSV